MKSKGQWLPFPNRFNPKVWISENDEPENGLKLYNPYSRKGRIAKYWFALLHKYGKPFLQSCYQYNTLLDNLSGTLSEILGNDDFAISYSTGTPGPHRKFTAQISRDRIPFAYAKIGTTPNANTLVRQEHETLQMLGELNITSAQLPHALGFSASSEQTILCQSAPQTAAKTRPAAATAQDARFLTELIIATRSSAYADEIIHSIMQSVSTDLGRDTTPTILLNSLDYIKAAFAKKPVQTAFSHGDYAPWNTYLVAPQSLYVFDWEYGEQNKPLLNDFFHYLFMPARLIYRIKPGRVARIMLEIGHHPVFGEAINELDIGESDLAPYALLYLLTQIARQYSQEQLYDAYIIECIHIILIAKGYPKRKSPHTGTATPSNGEAIL